jgi:uncharacterized membrane protein YfcA
MISLLATIGLGLAIGGAGGLFGIGGGLIAIPVLGLVYGMDQRTAQGTALVMVVPAVILAFWRYSRHVRLDIRIAASLALTAAPSTYLAARLATNFHAARLRVAFAGFLLVVALIIARHLLAPPAAPGRHPRSAGRGRHWSASQAGSFPVCSGSAERLSPRRR